ncbi:UNVERIFIED_CONTAM: hypothetical protein Slati_1163000, partial [Sesamum latifolium]
ELLALLVYVDDVLITCHSELHIIETKRFLLSSFTTKDLEHAKYFLGLEIARSPAGTSIMQNKFIRDIIQDTGLLSSKSASTPLHMGVKLSSQDASVLPDPELYRCLVGRLLYLSFTRPDSSFASQYYNADWASFVDSRCSLTGYCIFLGGALISWKTKKKTTIAHSTVEAEYRNLGSTVCELKWIPYLPRDLSIQVPLPIPLYCDNQTAFHIAANPVFHERTKHLEID